MTDEETIRRIVKEAVHETLSGLGWDVRDLKEMQADMLYLRQSRKSKEQFSNKVTMTLITAIVTAAIYAVWDSLKRQMKGG